MKEKNRKWWILLAMTSCISMIFLDITVLPVALPTISRSLDLTPLGLQWVVNGYILALTLFLIAGGRLGDRLGHRKTFILGLFTFSIASALCGLSNSQFTLTLFRILQGVGAAILVPNAVPILFRAFPKDQRGKAMGLYISIGSIFLALGPLIGGVFSQYFSWRLIFWINLPIALIGYLLTIYSVPHTEPNHRKYDTIGFLLATLGICCLVIPLMMARNWGWTSFLTLGLLALGVVLIIFLVLFDREAEDPYINFDFFKKRNFSGTVIALFAVQFILMITVFWAIYFQNVFDYTPSQAGLITLLANIPIIFVAPLAGHLLDRYGPVLPVTIGFCLLAGSLLWFVQNIDNRDLPHLLSAIIPFGIGIPLIFTPAMTNALNEVSEQKRGLASGTLMMLRQLGGTMGLAIVSTLFFSVQGAQFAGALQMHKETHNLNPHNFQGLLARTPEAQAALLPLSEQTQLYVKQNYLHAYMDAFWSINVLALIIALLALTATLFFIRKSKAIP